MISLNIAIIAISTVKIYHLSNGDENVNCNRQQMQRMCTLHCRSTCTMYEQKRIVSAQLFTYLRQPSYRRSLPLLKRTNHLKRRKHLQQVRQCHVSNRTSQSSPVAKSAMLPDNRDRYEKLYLGQLNAHDSTIICFTIIEFIVMCSVSDNCASQWTKAVCNKRYFTTVQRQGCTKSAFLINFNASVAIASILSVLLACTGSRSYKITNETLFNLFSTLILLK